MHFLPKVENVRFIDTIFPKKQMLHQGIYIFISLRKYNGFNTFVMFLTLFVSSLFIFPSQKFSFHYFLIYIYCS